MKIDFKDKGDITLIFNDLDVLNEIRKLYLEGLGIEEALLRAAIIFSDRKEIRS